MLVNTLKHFHALHEQRFGHSHPEQVVQIVAVRVKATVQPAQPALPATPYSGFSSDHAAIGTRSMVFAAGEHMAQVYDRAKLRHGNRVIGPALLVQNDSTFLLPPLWEGVVDAWGNITATVSSTNDAISTNDHPTVETQQSRQQFNAESAKAFDAVSLEIFKHLFASAAEEMGVTLGRTAYSPNIKERKNYSCACFDAQAQ